MKQFGISYYKVNGLVALEGKSLEKLFRQVEALKFRLVTVETNRQYITVLRSIYKRLQFGSDNPTFSKKYWKNENGYHSPNSFGERICKRIEEFEKGMKPYKRYN